MQQNWTPWDDFLGKRVVVYTATYHFLGTVAAINVDGLGISYADFTDAKQIHDEKTPWQFDVSLLLGECRTPVTAIAGFGIRQLPSSGVTEKLV
jgi:hypothetical protein